MTNIKFKFNIVDVFLIIFAFVVCLTVCLFVFSNDSVKDDFGIKETYTIKFESSMMNDYGSPIMNGDKIYITDSGIQLGNITNLTYLAYSEKVVDSSSGTEITVNHPVLSDVSFEVSALLNADEAADFKVGKSINLNTKSIAFTVQILNIEKRTSESVISRKSEYADVKMEVNR